MIPQEVADIAQILAAKYKGMDGDYEQFLDEAWEIYNQVVKPIIDRYKRADLGGGFILRGLVAK